MGVGDAFSAEIVACEGQIVAAGSLALPSEGAARLRRGLSAAALAACGGCTASLGLTDAAPMDHIGGPAPGGGASAAAGSSSSDAGLRRTSVPGLTFSLYINIITNIT